MKKLFHEGLVIGRFEPLHLGHCYLIQTALDQCEHVTVLVGTQPWETIDGHVRYEWVSETFPQATVIHNTEDALPDWNIPNYWSEWARMFGSELPKIDAVFSSEPYGLELANILKAQHVMVDNSRHTVPVSGTKIRNNPMEYWDYIAPIARPYFVKRVLIIGGESCGKSTIAEYLANHYKTQWVPEFARDYLAVNGNVFDAKAADDIILGQMKLEEELALQANRVLFCDTDNLVTREYTVEYGFRPAEYMKKLANNKRYDLYLFLDSDLPWVDDGMRDRPNRREEIFRMFKRSLESRRIKYTLINGVGQKRFDLAVKVVDDFLSNLS